MADVNTVDLTQEVIEPGSLTTPEKDVRWFDSTWMLYSFYEKIDFIDTHGTGYVRCLECKNVAFKKQESLEPSAGGKQPKGIVPRKNSTTSQMIQHYSHHHPTLFLLYKEKKEYVEKKRMELQLSRDGKRKLDENPEGVKMKQTKLMMNRGKDLALNIVHDKDFQKKWDMQLARFAAKSHVSLNILGGEHFKELINLLQAKARYGRLPVFNVKSRISLTKDMEKLASTTREEIASIILHFKSKVPSVGVTCDHWSSLSGESFMSLTIQFLTPEFDLVQLTPYIHHFPARHTGENIKLVATKMFEILGILGIKKYVSTDNAANIKCGFRSAEDVIQMLCILHTMQLGVKDTFKVTVTGVFLKTLLNKIQKLAVAIKKSSIMLKELKEACSKLQINYVTIQKSQKTRFNSRFLSISSYIKNKPALLELFASTIVCDKWGQYEIGQTEWRVLEGMEAALKQVVLVTKALEGERYPTSCLVVSKLYELQENLKVIESNAEINSSARDFAKKLRQKMNDRIPDCGTRNSLYSVGHYLDPYYRGIILKTYNKLTRVKKNIVDTWECATTESNNNSEVNDNEENPDSNIDEDDPIEKLLRAENSRTGGEGMSHVARRSRSSRSVLHVASPLEVEFQIFENKPKVSKEVDRLHWWGHDAQNDLPKLRRIAQEVLSVPVSSAKSERTFSKSGKVGTKSRMSLTVRHLEELTMINDNIDETNYLMSKYGIEKLDTQCDFSKWVSIVETIPEISDEGAEDTESEEDDESSSEEEDEPDEFDDIEETLELMPGVH